MILASVFLYFTVFFKVPMGSIVISTVSPFLRNLGLAGGSFLQIIQR